MENQRHQNDWNKGRKVTEQIEVETLEPDNDLFFGLSEGMVAAIINHPSLGNLSSLSAH